MLLDTTHTIKERQATHNVRPEDILFSRMLTLDNQSIFVGMAPYVIPAEYHDGIIKFKELLMEENENRELTPEVLRNDFDTELYHCFFDIMKVIFNQP